MGATRQAGHSHLRPEALPSFLREAHRASLVPGVHQGQVFPPPLPPHAHSPSLPLSAPWWSLCPLQVQRRVRETLCPVSRVEQKPPIPGLDSLRISVEAKGSGTQGGNGRRGAPSSRPPLCRRCLGHGLRLYLGVAGGAGAARERASPSLCVPGVSAPGHHQPWPEPGGAGMGCRAVLQHVSLLSS